MNIEILDSEVDAMAEFLHLRKKHFIDQIEINKKEIKKIESLLLQLKTSRPLIYSNDWNWIKKIKFALNEIGRPATSKEIAQFLTNYDLKPLRLILSGVSSNLSVYSKEETDHFIKTKNKYDSILYSINKTMTRE